MKTIRTVLCAVALMIASASLYSMNAVHVPGLPTPVPTPTPTPTPCPVCFR